MAQQTIRDSQSEGKAERKDQDRLMIRSQVPRTLDGDLSAGDMPGLSPDQLPPDLVLLDYGMDGGIDSSGGYVKICLRVYLTHTGENTRHASG